jgi:PTH2 family peptidyl-tRNA hydrolase
MSKGKLCAQCGHAAVAAYEHAVNKAPNCVGNWIESGQTKVDFY